MLPVLSILTDRLLNSNFHNSACLGKLAMLPVLSILTDRLLKSNFHNSSLFYRGHFNSNLQMDEALLRSISGCKLDPSGPPMMVHVFTDKPESG